MHSFFKLLFVLTIFSTVNFVATSLDVSAADVTIQPSDGVQSDVQAANTMIPKWYKPCEELSEGASQEEQDEWDDEDWQDVKEFCPDSIQSKLVPK